MAAGVVSMLGFGTLLVLVRLRRTEAFDLAITMRVQAMRHRRLKRLMTAISWPGFPPQSRVIPLAAMAGLWLTQLPLAAAFLLLAWGTAALSSLLKAYLARPRPVSGEGLRVALAPLGGTSFPSGHVLTYVGVYGWLAIVAHGVIGPAWPRRMVVVGLGALIAMVGPSRVYLGHHWATDVAASYLLGSSYLVLLTAGYQRLAGARR
jgi:membrane-associated phospholipid phosphatase